MAILKDISQLIKTATQSCVYGTFSQTFDPKEFEREREDGATILDLNPDCRVFIGGAELTADIDSVNINNSMDGSRCTISLHNPRGKYEISKMDLMKKWREDKDILAAYTYKELKKQDPLNYDKLAQKLGGTILGTQGANQVGQAIDMTKQIIDTMGGLAKGIPQSKGVTRMLFETKFYSGITRKAGDIVFDYRDPVIVFMKGRFSPFWYFAFTGIIVSYSDVDAYGESNMLTLNCEDTATLWKRTKMSMKGSFFGMSNLENRILNSNTSTKSKPYGDPGSNLTFTNMLKVVAFTFDYGLKTKNCFPSSMFITLTPGTSSTKNSSGNFISRGLKNPSIGNQGDPLDINYLNYLNKIRKGLGIGNTFKLTDNGLVGSAISRIANQPTGVRSMSALEYSVEGNTFVGGPNNKPFSAANSVYFQYNEICYPAGKFTGETISKLFDLSVRLWECQHDIQVPPGSGTPKSNSSNTSNETNGTGWKDNKYFGICGNHPAMKYNFIDNFNMLGKIWSLLYTRDGADIYKLKLTLYDKIYETVVGSPTESVPNGTKMSSIPEGSNFNFFRPRLFAVLPQKYAGIRKLSGQFADLGKIDSEGVTTIWDYLKGALKPIEYNFYCSPCGDLYVEPELYDMHPIEFSNQIEPRSIILKSVSTELSNTSKTIPSQDTQKKTGNDITPDKGVSVPVKVTHTAYFYNPKANHPFFIMEKDRIRNTHEFSADKIVSSVEVVGSVTNTGGIAEGAIQNSNTLSLFRMATGIAQGNASKITDSNRFIEGRYVADGFQNFMKDSVANQKFLDNAKAYEDKFEDYKRLVFITILSKLDVKLGIFIKGFIDGIFDLKKDKSIDWNSGIVSDTLEELRNRGFETSKSRYPRSVNLYIFNKYCSGIKSSLKISENTISGSKLDELLNKNIRDILFIHLDPKGAKNSNAVAFNNTLQAAANKGQSKGYLSEETIQLLKEYEQSGLFSLDDSAQSQNSIMGDKRNVISNLIMLQEPVSLIKDNVIQTLYKDLQTLRNSSFLPREMRAVTIADLVKLREQGAYDPRTDLIRTYGFKRGEPIQNQYILNGEEATSYATAVFNRLLGEARSMNVTFVGRPEMWLNRPYFLERKDCIGLCRNYSISYKYGSDFTSTTLLTYIRNNSLTYAYSLDPNLDVIKPPHNNGYFYTQGKLYLQLQESLQKAGTAASKSLNSLISSSTKSNSGKITGEITSGIINDASDSIKTGGLYVVNDVLGHMDYDSRGDSKVGVADDKSQGSKDNLYPLYGEDLLMSIAKEIKMNLEAVETFKKDIKSAKEKKPSNTKNLESYTSDLKKEKEKNTAQITNDTAVTIRALEDSIRTTEEEGKALDDEISSKTSAIQKIYSNILYSSSLKAENGKVYDATIFGSSGENDWFLTDALRKLYEKDKGANFYGLFYKLYSTHIDVKGIPQNQWYTLNVTTKVVGNSYGNASAIYFIKGKK